MNLLAKVSRTLQRSVRPASEAYTIIDRQAAQQADWNGWHDAQVAAKQDEAYRPLLEGLRRGEVRADFAAIAQAVEMTGIDGPSILEVGCASGYYAQVLTHLVGPSIRYTGLDYSPAMIALAQAQQPQQTFICGDATDLPMEENCFDIVINGVALMHIIQYEKAIAEAHRVARSYCIMHSVPLLQKRTTTYLQKKAYGQMTVEIIFNQEQLFALIQQSGLEICSVIDSIEYDLCPILGEPTTTKTILCRKC